MREIKFRCWDDLNKIMYQNVFMRGNMWFIERGHGHGNCEILGIEPMIKPMQFTGLKDKNGKEIYEGDIVKWSDGNYKHPSNPRIAEVRFDPELCFFAFNVDGGHKFGFSNFIYTDTEKHIEVIGNIYENPDLSTSK